MDASISPAALAQSLRSETPPLVIDVRRRERFIQAPDLIQGALRRDPEDVHRWKDTLPPGREVIVYCVHGHEVSQNAAKALGARYVEGGIEAWRESGGALDSKPRGAPTRWVTRERPKIDRIACPWLVRRFVDPQAEFLYAPPEAVLDVAKEKQAVGCSFDALLKHFRLQDPALQTLALIVRGADTNRLDLAPQAAGLAAISLGLSRTFENDLEMLEHGMVMYDALYAWCKAKENLP